MLPPNCYTASDARIFWLSRRPYWIHRLLGKGGFGEVYEVEMLLPQGLAVNWEENGDFNFDDEGCIMLKEQEDSPSEDPVLGGTGTGRRTPPVSGTGCFQEQQESSCSPRASAVGAASSPAPEEGALPLALSMVSLSPARPVNTDSVSAPVALISDQQHSVGFLQGSGAFFALKIQSARNPKQLEVMVQEVENLKLLSDTPGIIQLKDYSINKKSLHLIILMELGCCDLHEFLSRQKYHLDIPSVCQLWQTLVTQVDSLHGSDIIHRDIKPQNFILVPTRGHRDCEMLARMSARETPCEKTFRLLTGEGGGDGGDVELVLKDPSTGKTEVLFLAIKMTDFGIARTLDADVSHLSVQGPNGTLVYMAPEAVRQTVNGCRRVSKRVDVWALGIMLYQLLHAGQTPFGHYLTKWGAPEALLAVASETVNREAMDFDASEIWTLEKARVLRENGNGPETTTTTTAETVKALVASYVGLEFLVRVCKCCLAFDANDRFDAEQLRVWIDRANQAAWGRRTPVVAEGEFVQAAFNIDSSRSRQAPPVDDLGEAELSVGTTVVDDAAAVVNSVVASVTAEVDREVARIGERVGAFLFPKIWKLCGQDPLMSGQDPGGRSSSSRRAAARPGKKEVDSPDGEGAAPALPLVPPRDGGAAQQDNPPGPAEDDVSTDVSRRARCVHRHVLIAIFLGLLGSLCAGSLCAGILAASWSGGGSSSSPDSSGDDSPGDDSSSEDVLLPVFSSDPSSGFPSTNPASSGVVPPSMASHPSSVESSSSPAVGLTEVSPRRSPSASASGPPPPGLGGGAPPTPLEFPSLLPTAPTTEKRVSPPSFLGGRGGGALVGAGAVVPNAPAASGRGPGEDIAGTRAFGHIRTRPRTTSAPTILENPPTTLLSPHSSPAGLTEVSPPSASAGGPSEQVVSPLSRAPVSPPATTSTRRNSGEETPRGMD